MFGPSTPKPFTLTDTPCPSNTPHKSQQLETKPLSKYVAKTAHSILGKRRQGKVQRVEHDMKMRQLSALKKQQNTKRVAGLAGVGNTLAARGLSRAKPADGRHNLTDFLEGAGVKEDEIDDDEQDGEGGKVCHLCMCVWCACGVYAVHRMNLHQPSWLTCNPHPPPRSKAEDPRGGDGGPEGSAAQGAAHQEEGGGGEAEARERPRSPRG